MVIPVSGLIEQVGRVTKRIPHTIIILQLFIIPSGFKELARLQANLYQLIGNYPVQAEWKSTCILTYNIGSIICTVFTTTVLGIF